MLCAWIKHAKDLLFSVPISANDTTLYYTMCNIYVNVGDK